MLASRAGCQPGFRGQVAGILLLGLALSQALAALLYLVLLPEWQRELRPEEAVTKIEVAVRLLESVNANERPPFARCLTTRASRVRYAPDSAFSVADRSAAERGRRAPRSAGGQARQVNR